MSRPPRVDEAAADIELVGTLGAEVGFVFGEGRVGVRVLAIDLRGPGVKEAAPTIFNS